MLNEEAMFPFLVDLNRVMTAMTPMTMTAEHLLV